jgi:hypothetical protein
VASDLKLTAEQLAELETEIEWAIKYSSCGPRTHELHQKLPALIAAAKRLAHRDQQWMNGINEACGTTIRFDPLDWETRHLKPLDTFVHDLRARATAAEARVGELTKALSQIRMMSVGHATDDEAIFNIATAALTESDGTALKPQGEERTTDISGLKPDPRSTGPIEAFAMRMSHRRAEHLEMYAAAYMQTTKLDPSAVSLVEEHLDGGRTGFRWTFEPKQEPRP